MLNTAEKMVEKVNYFACGYCTNDLKRVFKDFNKTIVNFYAGVFLIKHKKMGYIPVSYTHLYEVYCSIRPRYNKFKSNFI